MRDVRNRGERGVAILLNRLDYFQMALQANEFGPLQNDARQANIHECLRAYLRRPPFYADSGAGVSDFHDGEIRFSRF